MRIARARRERAGNGETAERAGDAARRAEDGVALATEAAGERDRLHGAGERWPRRRHWCGRKQSATPRPRRRCRRRG